MEGPKACVHMYVYINIPLPYYIKVTNLKTVLTYKQIKVKQSPLNGLNSTWHAARAVYLWLLRDYRWRTMCGSWKLAATFTPITYACSSRSHCEHTKHWAMHTDTKILFTPCIQMVCVSISSEDPSQQSRPKFSQIHPTGLLGILFHTKWKNWNVLTGIFCLHFRHQKSH